MAIRPTLIQKLSREAFKLDAYTTHKHSLTSLVTKQAIIDVAKKLKRFARKSARFVVC